MKIPCRSHFYFLSALSPHCVRLFALLTCGLLAGCGSSIPSLQITPNPINIPQGGSGAIALATTSSSSQTVVHGSVDGRLASTWPNVLWGLPQSSDEPIIVSPPGTPVPGAVAKIYVPATETVGLHKLDFNVQDANGNTLRTESVTVNVTAAPANGFRITSAPASLSVAAGSSTPAVVTVTAFGTFSGQVSLSADSYPPGFTATLSAASVTLPANGTATVTLTVSVPQNTSPRDTGVTVRGFGGGLPSGSAISVPLTITSSGTGGGGGGGGVTGTTYVADDSKALKVPDLASAVFQDTGTQLPVTGGSHMYVSAGGTIYLADKNHHQILSFTNFTTPNITVVGSQGSGALQFKNPNAVTLGPDGKIYVADTGNNRIVRMDDMTGAGFTTWQPSGSSLDRPECVFVDSANAMYVTDTFHFRILRANSFASGSFQEIGTYGNTTGHFFLPHGIFVQNGKITVTDAGRIVQMDNIAGANWQEINETTIGTGVLQTPQGIFVDSTGRITVADSQKMQVLSFAGINGTGKVVWPPAGTNPLQTPIGVFIR